MIIDCFPFFNELDLLEIRLNSLAPYVDRFVLCEMTVTHSNNPKPLFFSENRERFKDFPITHLVVHPPDKKWRIEMGGFSGDAWRLEHYQRECLMIGLKDCAPNDIVILSDLDEIPNLEKYDGQTGAFKQKLYYYYFNTFTNTRRWRGSIATKYKDITTLTRIRNRRNQTPVAVGDGGWHFSTLGSPDDIKYKIQSFAHTELNADEYLGQIAQNREQLVDPYGRVPKGWEGYPAYRFTVEMPSGPKWLLDNKERYAKYFYSPSK